jgi:hypothetical protein
MATLYPIRIGKLKFFVNPTKIKVQKRSQINELRTIGGTVFQVWPNLPDEITFEGMAFGYRSILELRGLQREIQLDPANKLTTLTYKNKKMEIYVRDISVSADAENPRQFMYTISCVSKTPFDLDKMPIGQLPGIKAEFDFQASQLRSATEAIANLPIDAVNNLTSVFGQIFGKTGSSQNGLGIFIGRPRSGPFSS